MAMLVITEGVRPEKPENATQLGFTEELWSIVEQCWLGDWRARPGVEDILSCLNNALPSWQPPVLPVTFRMATTAPSLDPK